MFKKTRAEIDKTVDSIYIAFRPYIDSKADFLEYLIKMIKNEWIRTEDNQICYPKENLQLMELIPRDKIVIDVGCGLGLQHVLFKNHRGYIGIQKFIESHNCVEGFEPEYRVFTENAKIISGYFRDVWEQCDIRNTDDYFGIANCSIWNAEDANKKDIEIFKRLFPKNYFATKSGGEIIKYDSKN